MNNPSYANLAEQIAERWYAIQSDAQELRDAREARNAAQSELSAYAGADWTRVGQILQNMPNYPKPPYKVCSPGDILAYDILANQWEMEVKRLKQDLDSAVNRVKTAERAIVGKIKMFGVWFVFHDIAVRVTKNHAGYTMIAIRNPNEVPGDE